MSCPSLARGALEVMRQPIEDKIVTIRRQGSLDLPGQFPAHRGDEPLPVR